MKGEFISEGSLPVEDLEKILQGLPMTPTIVHRQDHSSGSLKPEDISYDVDYENGFVVLTPTEETTQHVRITGYTNSRADPDIDLMGGSTAALTFCYHRTIPMTLNFSQ